MSIKEQKKENLSGDTRTPNDRENVINFIPQYTRHNTDEKQGKRGKKTVIFNYYSQQFFIHSNGNCA